MKKSPRLDLDNARHNDQKAVMQKWLDNGQSPFMPENIDQQVQPILYQGKFWYVIKNRWPYLNTREHFLIIANQYWTALAQITPAASQELITIAQKLAQENQVQGGALCLRFGDTNYSGGTVDHLHWQFIVPDLDADNYERVHFAIGKKREKLSLID